ncbi:MAG: PEP-CTERM sorting domain-containing protein [Fimbriimonadales bacterium]
MKRYTLATLALSLAMIGASHAQYSVDGTDWLIDINANLVVTGTINTTVAVNVTAQSVTINQTNNDFGTDSGSFPPGSEFNDFGLPLNFPPYISANLSGGFFTIGGNNGVKARQSIPGPIVIPQSVSGLPLDIRLRNIRLNVAGLITGVNTSINDSYGARVWEITGIPSTNPFSTNIDTSWGQIRDIEAFPPLWVRIGGADLVVNSWRLYRPVPEPASMLALGTGLVGLLGLRRRKQ